MPDPQIVRGCSLEDIYPEISDDNYIAFLQLEAEFRKEFEHGLEERSINYDYSSRDFMNKVLSAAKALEIDALSEYDLSAIERNDFQELFDDFLRAVDSVKIQVRIANSRCKKKDSVGLSQTEKSKLQALIEKIRVEVEASKSSVSKKERIFEIVSELSKEINKDRTPYARFGDLARGLAGLSNEVSKELADGAEPWWKWFKVAMGVIDEAKEAEPKLPKPPELKRIDPPRKKLPPPSRTDMDDEIPF